MPEVTSAGPYVDTEQFRPHPNRRLVDKLVIAAHAACDEDALELADMLVCLAETAILMERQRKGVDRRKHHDAALVRLHRRLFCLRAVGR